VNPQTQKRSLAGPAGALQCAIDSPAGPPRGVAVLCHPNPVQGGTMDNKVMHTLARAFVQLGCTAVRFNFRGVGESAGVWDEGRGEIDDALAVIEAFRAPKLPLVLGGFSFGGYVATQAGQRLAAQPAGQQAARLVLIAPAVGRFDVAPVPADTVLVHGEADDVVTLVAVLNWARPQNLPLTVVPGAGHFFHGQLPLLKGLVTQAFETSFFSET
jgi:uncharacterized protein